MMDIMDQIAKIIKDEYAPNGFEDEGRSTSAAHDVMKIVEARIERLEALLVEAVPYIDRARISHLGVSPTIAAHNALCFDFIDRIRAALAGK